MANNTNQVQKTLGEQMADLLWRKPNNFDVTFSVGPDKIKVEAVKFILKAASPVFERKFDENWENGVVMDGNGIPLPDIDPIAFQLFVNLLTLDAWSVDFLNSLKLSANNLLNLLGLCRRYEITKAIENLEEVADDFIQWASNQCTIKGLEKTGENFREVLGDCLFQIRFPTMSIEEFAKVCKFKNNFLKGDEQLAIFLFIASTNDEKTNYDKAQLPFKINCRVNNRSSSFGCSVLSLPPQYKLTTSPSFVCNGSQRRRTLVLHLLFSTKLNKKISLHGFGFLGPVDGDANFDVTVQIKRAVNGFWAFDSGTFKTNIFAPKGKVLYFLFDEPISLESNATYGSWGDYYCIIFSLKGPYNIAQYKGEHPQNESLKASGVQFYLNSDWNCYNPVAELLFKMTC